MQVLSSVSRSYGDYTPKRSRRERTNRRKITIRRAIPCVWRPHSITTFSPQPSNCVLVGTPGTALRAEIDSNLKKPRVIFVCGSSGDGKSELFRRIYASYGTKVRFHLDATHSFDPQKDPIQTLDDQFSEFKAGKQTLVVGINIGMLENYADDGNSTLGR
ncbi:MAG: DNA phosphorothioation-dependent restriction protein DptF [Planctomycetota bacterium]